MKGLLANKFFVLFAILFIFLFSQSGLVSAGECLPEMGAYWSFDENYTGPGISKDFFLENDGEINGMNDGTLSGGVTQNVNGQIGNAYEFDGVNDYFEVSDDDSLDRPGALTFSAWVYSDDPSQTGGIGGKRGGLPGSFVSEGNYLLEIAGGKYGFTYNDGSWRDIVSSTSPEQGWHHLVGVYRDGGTAEIWVDGVKEGSQSGLGSPLTNNGHFFIGGCYNSYFEGKIDEVRIYDRALSSGEISELYNATDHSAVREGLVGEWRLEETSGSTAYDTSYIQSGQVNEAYEFDGVDDYVKIPHDDSLDFGLDDFTVSVWSKTSWASTAYQQFLAKYAGSHQGWYLGLDENQEPIWKAGDGNVIDVRISQNYADGNWHHYMGMRDGDTLRLFIDGEQVGTADFSGVGSVDTSTDLFLGTNGAATRHFINGKIDEVAIWDRALNSSEIQKIYDMSKDPNNNYYCYGSPEVEWVSPTEDIYVAKNKFWNYTLKATCPPGPPCGKIDIILDPEEAEKLKEGRKFQVIDGKLKKVVGDDENAEETEKDLWEKITGFFVKLFSFGGKND